MYLSHAPLKGMFYMNAAMFCFVVNDTIAKLLVATYQPAQVMFLRSLFTIIFIVVSATAMGHWHLYRMHQPGTQLLRACLAGFAVTSFFYAFGVLPLADAYVITFVAPLLMAVFSGPILGEKVTRAQWLAVGIGFAGVLVMLNPSGNAFNLGGLAALIGGTLYAIAMVLTRKIAKTDHGASVTLMFFAVSFLLSGLAMPWLWEPIQRPLDFGLCALNGLISLVGQLLMVKAFRFAPPAVLGPIEYLSLIYATGFGYLLCGDIPGVTVWVGASIIMTSGLLLIYVEQKNSKLMR